MKKQFDLHETIKEAVKEALLEVLAQMQGVSPLSETDEEAPKDDDDKEGDNKGPIRPDPMYGIGGFSLR